MFTRIIFSKEKVDTLTTTRVQGKELGQDRGSFFVLLNELVDPTLEYVLTLCKRTWTDRICD